MPPKIELPTNLRCLVCGRTQVHRRSNPVWQRTLRVWWHNCYPGIHYCRTSSTLQKDSTDDKNTPEYLRCFDIMTCNWTRDDVPFQSALFDGTRRERSQHLVRSRHASAFEKIFAHNSTQLFDILKLMSYPIASFLFAFDILLDNEGTDSELDIGEEQTQAACSKHQ